MKVSAHKRAGVAVKAHTKSDKAKTKVPEKKSMSCWAGYEARGQKMGRSGKMVNNCVKIGTP